MEVTVSAVLVASTDVERHVVILTVEGSALDDGHVDVMQSALAVLPTGFGMVIDLTGLATVGAAVVEDLRDIAREAASFGRTLVYVCGNIDTRAALIVSDLDTLAPVVAAIEFAVPLVRAAA